MVTDEAERIRAEYARRGREIPPDRYSPAQPHNLFAQQQKSRAVMKALVEAGMTPLVGRSILDIGCGDGQQLLELVSWGARRSDLAGIDLINARVELARARLGGSEHGETGPDLRGGDASHLPWADATFDLAVQNTVFTSILDPGVRQDVAAEIVRVLKPGGILVWYDFLFNNPKNPHVRGVGAREIRSLFPGCAIGVKRITLAPPVARRLVPVSWIGSLMLETLRVCNTHYLALIRKGESTASGLPR
jgi:SAM-dependent methyltransferase